MATDDQLFELLGKNAELFAAYEEWSNAQIMLLAGTVDDPNSFNETGGKTGILGYYPVVNVSGQTIYVPCQARLMAIALGGSNAAVLEQLIGQVSAKVVSIDEAVTELGVATSLKFGEIDDHVAQKDLEIAASISAAASATALAGNKAGLADEKAALAGQKAAAAQTVVDAGAAIIAAAQPVTGVVDRTTTLESKTAGLIPDARMMLSTVNPALLNLLAGFVDEAGFFGAGIAADGTWTAKSLQALSGVVTPLLSAASLLMPAGGLASMGRDATIKFDERGSIGRSQGGARLDLIDTNYDAVIQDEAGNVLFGVLGQKIIGPRFVAELGNDRLTVSYFNGVAIDFGKHDYDVAIADVNGNVLAGWLNGTFYGPGKSSDSAALDAQDAANKAYSRSVYMRRVAIVQLPTAAYNILIIYGQSLAQGDETWPALSRVARFGNLMLGGHTMSSTDNGTFTQFTPTGFQPLVAQTVNGATRYDAAGEAALAAGNGSRGEPANIGWANGAKARLNDYLIVGNAADRSFVTINVAKSGATIGELEKGHTEGGTEFYNKYLGSLTQAAAAAGAASIAVAGIMYMQGEHDYSQATGHTSLNMTYAKYKAKLALVQAAMQADAKATTLQLKVPAFLIYQTGASFTRDADENGVPGLHVGMAQLDLSLESDTAFMVGPVYPYTDKGGHLDSNGSRWFGHQIAKVWHQVVIEGRDWEPLRPIKITKSGTSTIYVSYHVPFAPLVFDEPQLSGGNEYSNATKGFRLTDDTGAIGISEVAIVRDTIIRITTSRAIGANPKVWYASQGTTGNGMVRDSDPALASDNYVYEPDRGMYATANIAQFVNKPYPLWNWSVAFYLPVT